MIKIIKAGTRKKIECSECVAVLSYEAEDIETTAINQQNGWSDEQYITCPQCKTEILLMATR